MTPNSQLSSYKNKILKSSLAKSNKSVSPFKNDEIIVQKEKDDTQNLLHVQLQEKNEELIAQKKLNQQAYEL